MLLCAGAKVARSSFALGDLRLIPIPFDARGRTVFAFVLCFMCIQASARGRESARRLACARLYCVKPDSSALFKQTIRKGIRLDTILWAALALAEAPFSLHLNV